MQRPGPEGKARKAMYATTGALAAGVDAFAGFLTYNAWRENDPRLMGYLGVDAFLLTMTGILLLSYVLTKPRRRTIIVEGSDMPPDQMRRHRNIPRGGGRDLLN